MPQDSTKYRKPTKELISLGRSWLHAKTAADMLHPIVTEIQAKLLDELQISYDPKWAEKGARDCVGRITDPKYSYLMSDEDGARYFPALDAAYKAAGYDLPTGHCPYLVADHLRIQAENALLDACAEFIEFPQLRAENLYGENREKAINLHMGWIGPYIKEEGLQIEPAKIPTVKLRGGVEVTAKTYEGQLMAITYANRTGAKKAAAKLGAEWTVYKGIGRPWFVARADQFKKEAA